MGQIKSCTGRPVSVYDAKSTGDISDLHDETIPSSPSIISLNSTAISDDGKTLEEAKDRIYHKLHATLNETANDDSMVHHFAEFIGRQKLYQELVNLNYIMFREIAKILENNAHKRLDRIKYNSLPIKRIHHKVKTQTQNGKSDDIAGSYRDVKAFLDNYDRVPTRRISEIINKQIEELESYNHLNSSKDNLSLVLLELVDATDCYAKSGCFKRSDLCEKEAKMIALQLALLPHDINIIDKDLSSSASHLHDLIISFDSFHCAKIVADAYDYNIGWRQALFKQVLLAFNLEYLDDYCDNCDLSTILVEELVLLYNQYMSNYRYQMTLVKVSNMDEAMKRIINKLDNIELKCRFYSQLGFEDAKIELINSDPTIGAHLRDLRLV